MIEWGTSTTENVVRLLLALIAAVIMALGYLVVQPVSLSSGVLWMFVSFAPPAIYYLGTRGVAASIAFGSLLVGITLLGWISFVTTRNDDGLAGLYPFTLFALTFVISLIGALLGAATERWGRSGR